MVFRRQVPGAGVKGKGKSAEEAADAVWRINGIKETRYKTVGEAERAHRRVKDITPSRHKARKEAKSRRPCRETCVRIHHSKGRKIETFLESFKETLKLSKHEILALVDSRDIGGLGVFAKWKQAQYENRKVIKRQIIFEMNSGRFINEIQDDGSLKMVPFIEDNPKKKTTKKVAKTYCKSCRVQMPTCNRHNVICKNCRPAISAAAFFSQVKEDQRKLVKKQP